MHFSHLGYPQRECRFYGTLTLSSPSTCTYTCTRSYISLPLSISSVLRPFVIPYTFIPGAPLFVRTPRRAGRQLVLNYETSLGAVTRDPERKGGPRERESPLKDVSHARVQPIERMHFSMRGATVGWRVVDVRCPPSRAYRAAILPRLSSPGE